MSVGCVSEGDTGRRSPGGCVVRISTFFVVDFHGNLPGKYGGADVEELFWDRKSSM